MKPGRPRNDVGFILAESRVPSPESRVRVSHFDFAWTWRYASTDHRRSTPMQYRRLGSSGLQLSALSFGAWVTFGTKVDRGGARELLACAYDHGVNFFDN